MHTVALPHVSLLLAAAFAVLQVLLSALVIQRRASAGITFMDGGDATLLKRMRTHGNFIEVAPMALVLLLILELAGLPTAWLWAIATALLLSRLLHAWGLLIGPGMFGRVAGTLICLFTLSCQALACVWLFAR